MTNSTNFHSNHISMLFGIRFYFYACESTLKIGKIIAKMAVFHIFLCQTLIVETST